MVIIFWRKKYNYNTIDEFSMVRVKITHIVGEQIMPTTMTHSTEFFCIIIISRYLK